MNGCAKCRKWGGLGWLGALKVNGNVVRFLDVAGGRGVDGRRAADDVGSSPTAAATGGGRPGTPLSERGLVVVVAGWSCGRPNSMYCV